MEEVMLPELVDVVPSWFNVDYGPKLDVDESALATGILRLASKAASVEIKCLTGNEWRLTWKVVYSSREYTEGHLIFNTHNLKCAFGLIKTNVKCKMWKCIRIGRCLNIPSEHHPSISIYLDTEDKIRRALLEFIEVNS